MPFEPPSEAPARKRRWPLVVAALFGLVALGGVAATVAVLLGRGKIQAKLEAIGERLGVRIEVTDIDLPIVGSIGAHGVRVYGQSGTLVAAFDRIETDLSLVDAALGQSRPGRITVHGGEVVARIADGHLVDLALPKTAASAPSTDPAEPLSMGLSDVSVRIEARQETSSGTFTAQPVTLAVTELELARDADRTLRAAARGVWTPASGQDPVPFTAAIDTAAGTVKLDLDAPQHLGITSPHGTIWVAIAGLFRERGGGDRGQPGSAGPSGGTEIRGLDVVRGDDRLSIDKLTVTGGGDGWAPDPAAATAVVVQRLAARHGARSLAAEEIALALEPEAGFAFPSPTLITLRDARGETPLPTGNGTLRAGADAVTVGLKSPQTQLAAGDPLAAVTELKLGRPKATLVVPPRDENGKTPDVADADATPGEAPLVLLGNDDDIPVEAVDPKTAGASPKSTGFGFLDRLFGEDGERRDPALSDFLPEALAARVSSLVPRLRALRPELADGSIEIVDSEGKSLVALEGASFSAGPTREGAEAPESFLTIAFRSSVLRGGVETGKVDITVAVDEAGVLQWVEGIVAGKDVANRLARFVPHLTVQPDAELSLDLRYARPQAPGSPHHIAGKVEVRNFTFEFWRISDREVKDLQGAATFDLSVDRKGRRLLLNLPELKMGHATMSASLDLTKPKKKLPSFTARLAMARQDCGKVFSSIPKTLIPDLSTLEATGQMEFDASLVADLENPRDLVLDVKGDVDDCRFLSLGPGIDLQALKGPFVHHPREPQRGVLDHIAVGPGTSQWVRSERLPDIVKLAAWVTEDRAYDQHAGVRWELVARALKIDLMHGRFVYGGSTITQQLVKNLYLTRTKNLARKLEEAIIAVQMERVLTKDEILTIYVNCIEYGPDIYGVKHAARQYFDKKVDELDALEAAFIMGLKPFPKAGYNQWLKGKLDEFWIRRIAHVMRLLPKFGGHIITAEEVEAFAPFQPAFHRP